MKSSLAACALLATLPCFAGCASTNPPEPSPVWVPSAQPRFATFHRTTTYALVYDAERDLLVIEDPIVSGSSDPAGRLTWIVSVPAQAAFETPIRVGEKGMEAWLLEQLHGRSSHAAPATGTVTLIGKGDDRVSAALDLTALGELPTAGHPERSAARLVRMVELERFVPTTPQYHEMKHRSGLAPAKKE